jgi:hypothetical protein
MAGKIVVDKIQPDTTNSLRIVNYLDEDLVTISDAGGLEISRTGVTSPVAGDGNVFSGTYTPTLTNVTNAPTIVANAFQYMRVGNVVTVSGSLNIDPTTASILTEVRISLPIASDLIATTQVSGTCHGNWVIGVGDSGSISGDSVNNGALLRTIPPNASAAVYSVQFTYLVR